MTCLLSDYAKGLPEHATPQEEETQGLSDHQQAQETQLRAPLPDYIEGRILEIENICLTPDVRKRMPFLNHIPVYSDIVFVELDLNHILSDETRQKFKAEIAKRSKRRRSKAQAEKRADRALLKEEMERINERKARLQIIDPNDDFFQVSTTDASEPLPAEGEEFGPILGSGSRLQGQENNHSHAPQTAALPPSIPAPVSTISFSDALRRGNETATLSSMNAFPALGSISESSFPALGVSSPSKPPAVDKKTATADVNATSSTVGGKKKKKSQKLLLFSTGGARGY
jgi:hypothetical protein